MTDATRRIGYSPLSILIHWVGAILVIILWRYGDTFADMPRGAERDAVMALHVSLGLVAVVVLGGRILWRLTARDGGTSKPETAPLDRLALFVKIGLLATLAVLLVTGPLSLWINGRPITFFGLTELASPLARNHDTAEILEGVHVVASKLILVLAALHVLGTLKHLVIDRDGTLMRMLAPWRDR